MSWQSGRAVKRKNDFIHQSWIIPNAGKRSFLRPCLHVYRVFKAPSKALPLWASRSDDCEAWQAKLGLIFTTSIENVTDAKSRKSSKTLKKGAQNTLLLSDFSISTFLHALQDVDRQCPCFPSNFWGLTFVVRQSSPKNVHFSSRMSQLSRFEGKTELFSFLSVLFSCPHLIMQPIFMA